MTRRVKKSKVVDAVPSVFQDCILLTLANPLTPDRYRITKNTARALASKLTVLAERAS